MHSFCAASPSLTAADWLAVDTQSSPGVARFDPSRPAQAPRPFARLAGATRTPASTRRGRVMVGTWREARPSRTTLRCFDTRTATRFAMGTLPFASAEDGGLSFDLDESGLFAAVDPDDSRDDLLYRVEFPGTFQLIGPIQVAGQTTVAIRGLAYDPLRAQLCLRSMGSRTRFWQSTRTQASPFGSAADSASTWFGRGPGHRARQQGHIHLWSVIGNALHEIDQNTGVALPRPRFIAFHSNEPGHRWSPTSISMLRRPTQGRRSRGDWKVEPGSSRTRCS